MYLKRQTTLAVSSLASLLLAPLSLTQEADHSAHMQKESAAGSHDEHAHHRQMMEAPASFKTSLHRYVMPALPLQDDAGARVQLSDVLGDDRPLVVNFIYTSCTTICPVMTATMLQLQRQIAEQHKGKVAMPAFVSISIDPDFDSPEVLKAYAARYGADWTFLTGKRSDVLAILRGFDAWRGSKSNHAAVTLMKAAGSKEWTRIEGLASAQQLANVWHALSG